MPEDIRMKSMIIKKALKISAIGLCCLFVFAPISAFAVWYSRGDLSNEKTSAEFKLGIKKDAFKSDGDIRIMSANLLVGYKSWGGSAVKPRAKMFYELLEAYNPDVIGLQELCDGWYCTLRNIPDCYKLVYPVSTGVFIDMTALAYNSETLELIDFGKAVFEEGNNPRLRRVVWGLFKIRSSGKKFIATSTHFDLMSSNNDLHKKRIMTSEAKAFLNFSNELQKKYGCPVISTGDYNSMEPTKKTRQSDAPFIYTYLSESLTDCKSVAQNKFCGEKQSLNAPSYDHIFINGKADVINYAVLSQGYLESMSDHYPIISDIILNPNHTK